MIRNGMRYRYLQEVERRRREREHNERLQQLHARWRLLNLPVQEELKLHLRLFGLDSAQHATTIVERLYVSPIDKEVDS